MSFLPGKRLVLLGIIVILLAAIPLTLYLVQKQQEIRSRAVPSTTLSFAPSSSQAAPLQKNVGETFTLDVMVNPGTNEVIWAELAINYDSTKLATAEAGLVPTNTLPGVVEGPSYTGGTSKITLSRMGAAELGGITSTTKVATITLKALAATDTTPTQITFGNQTVIRSTRGKDPGDLNVLSSTTPAFIMIAQATGTPTPTSPPPTGGQNQPPVCTALNVDRATSGSAPFSITFTANGNDSDGTINKVTFDFGDGPVQDVTVGGGIGTKTVSVQVSHAYNNAGTFNASAVLTDNNGATSAPTVCTQTITVSQAGTPTPTQGVGLTITPSATSTPTPTQVAQPSIIPPGPSDKIIGVGIVGIITTILGVLIFLAL